MENKSEIIEAEYREVGKGCTLPEITAEIRYITEQMNRTVLAGIIEIGRRFEQAKELVEFGKWGEYCEQYTGYSQSMAENYIKVYKEYGSEQYSIFGDLSKSQSIGNLEITKLIELTAIPADEREEFVEKNNVTEYTTVKELQELIRQQKEDISAAESKAAEKEKELADSIGRQQKIISDKDAEINSLKAELERRNAEEPTVPQDEMEKMMAEADEKAKQTLQEEIDRLEAEKEKAVTDAEKLQKKYDKLKDEGKKAEQDMQELKDSLSAAESKNETLQEEIQKLKKESMLGANEKLVRLNMVFETAQSDISKVSAALNAVKGQSEYEKLRAAVYQTLKNMVDEMQEGEANDA